MAGGGRVHVARSGQRSSQLHGHETGRGRAPGRQKRPRSGAEPRDALVQKPIRATRLNDFVSFARGRDTSALPSGHWGPAPRPQTKNWPPHRRASPPRNENKNKLINKYNEKYCGWTRFENPVKSGQNGRRTPSKKNFQFSCTIRIARLTAIGNDGRWRAEPAEDKKRKNRN